MNMACIIGRSYSEQCMARTMACTIGRSYGEEYMKYDGRVIICVKSHV